MNQLDKTKQYRILGLTMFASGKRWNKGNWGRGVEGPERSRRVGQEDDVVTSPPISYLDDLDTYEIDT